MKQKIKVMEHKPDVSDEEIRSYMNFDNLMANKKQLAQGARRRYVVTGAGLAAIVVVGWLFFDQKPVPNASAPLVPAQKAEPTTDVAQPVLTPSPGKSISRTKGHDEPAKHSAPTSALKAGDPIVKSVPPVEDIYIQAEPFDGYPALYNYLNANIHYPYESVKDSIQGVQTVSFVINAAGQPENIVIRESLGDAFDAESKRLISNMPIWKPATLNGKPMASKMSIPLTFQFTKIKSTKP